MTSAIWRIFAELEKPKRTLSKVNLTSMQVSIFSPCFLTRNSFGWIIKQIMNSAFGGYEELSRSRCYRPRWITPSSICLILHILRKPNSLIALLWGAEFVLIPRWTIDSTKLSHILRLQLFFDLEFLDVASHIGGTYEPSSKYCDFPARSLTSIT